jgi:hypothetical protein
MKIGYKIIITPREEKESFKFFKKRIVSKETNSYLWKNTHGKEVQGENKHPAGKGIWKKSGTFLENVKTYEKKNKPLYFK